MRVSWLLIQIATQVFPFSTAHQWYGESLQGQGRFEEALADLKLAHELDPLSLIINSVLGSNLGTAGHPDEAIQQFRRTLEMDPNFAPAQFMLAQVHEGKGDLSEALATYERAKAIAPTLSDWLWLHDCTLRPAEKPKPERFWAT